MKLGIVGLGLIGGSLFKALEKDSSIEFYLVTKNKETQKKLQDLCQNVSESLNILKSCDVIFVCTPISHTLKTLKELENILPQNTIVADVASVKSFIMNENFKFDFVGSHPMAGLETSGFESSIHNLFDGATWVLTPYKTTSNNTVKILVDLINKTGATPLITTAKDHDEAVAKISHLPMILSQALFGAFSNNNLALSLAASGFRDMTRLALSNTQMAEDMLNYNNQNIKTALNEFNLSLNDLLTKNEDYKNKIEKFLPLRYNMYSKEGKNIYNLNSNITNDN